MSNTPNYQLVDINELEAKLTEIATELRIIKGINENEKWSWQDNYVDNVKGIFSNVKFSDLSRGIEYYTLDRPGVPYDGEGNEFIILNIGEFANWSNLKELTIPKNKNVMAIDIGAFVNCSSLKEAIFPEARYCGAYAFQNCEEIETIKLPKWDGISVYGDLMDPNFAFAGCKKLKTFEAPLEELWASEFEGCESLEEIDLYNIKQTNGEAIFKNCKNLKKINLPSSAKELELQKGMFDGCEKLEEIDFSIFSNRTSIPEYCFRNCKTLTNYNANYLNIGNYAFSGCNNLKFLEDTEIGSIGIGGLEGCQQLEYIYYAYSDNISPGACANCINLRVFNGPSARGVLDHPINDPEGPYLGAFENCINLEIIQIGGQSGVFTDGKQFNGCNKIKQYLIPNYPLHPYFYEHHDNIEILSCGDMLLANNFFDGWSKLQEANLLQVTTLHDYTFKDCENLTRVYLPKVSSFGENIFENCSNLMILDFGSLATFNTFPAIDTSALNSLACGYSGTLYENILEKLKNIGDLSLTAITAIPDNAFLNNKNLWRFSAPSVTMVGSNSFSGCSELMEINLTGATILGDNVFDGCDKLHNLNVSNITQIENLGNNNFTKFKGLTFGLKEYPSNFLNNGSVESLHLTIGTNTNGSEAFANNKNLTSVVLDGTSYGTAEKMFANCSNLTSVRISGTTKATLDPTMFDGTPIMKEIGGGTIYVFSSKLSQYQNSYPNWNFAAG